MPYENIQLIAYEIYTGPSVNANGPRIYKGMSTDRDDMAYRVTLMLEAIECALHSGHIDSSAKCLKVFVAPEFYFRGTKGAYPINKVVGEARGQLANDNLLDMLRLIVQRKDFSDWLFIFGSIIAASEVPKTGKSLPQHEAYNICLIQRGNQGIEGSRVVVKEHKSAVDFIKISTTSGAVLDDAVRHLAAGKKGLDGLWTSNRGSGKEYGKNEYEGLGIFEIEGITFGIEICLDHAMMRLRQSPPGPKDPWVQIQIVPSCGMHIVPRSVVACKGGLVFNVDGSYTLNTLEQPEKLGAHSQLQQIVTPFTGAGNATLQKINHSPVAYPHRLAERIAPVFIDDLSMYGIAWDLFKPRVFVYPARKIPDQPGDARPNAFNLPANKPKWEEDNKHASCQRCGTAFTFTLRRHHCRACGRVLCSKCAPANQTIKLPHLGYNQPERVCHECYFQFTGIIKH